MTIYWARLENRAVLKVTGAECEDFLQNLVTQDVTRAQPQAAALLTPQGKLAFDFILQPVEDGFLIDCAADSAEAFVKKLNLYKLRRDVEIAVTELPVQVVWSDPTDTQAPEIKRFFEDPAFCPSGSAVPRREPCRSVGLYCFKRAKLGQVSPVTGCARGPDGNAARHNISNGVRV
jgi:hypothetical protein